MATFNSFSSELSPISPSTANRHGTLINRPSIDGSPQWPVPPTSATPLNRRDSSRDRATGSVPPINRGAPQRGAYSMDYEGPMASRSRSMRSQRSNRPLRYDDRDELEDDYYNGRDRDYWRDRDTRYPDRFPRRPTREVSRPPLAWRNGDSLDETSSSSSSKMSFSRPFFYDETQSQRQMRHRDEEMGYGHGPSVVWKQLSKEQKGEVLRLPLTKWMNSDFKNHFVASIGEFTGTTMFLFFAFAGAQVAKSQSNDYNYINALMYISLSFGFSLMVNVWVFFRISGGLFNPAVTLGMVLVKGLPPVRAACIFVSQLAGSIVASVIVRFLFPETFSAGTSLTEGVSQLRGVFIEAILTAELVFTIFMLAKEKHKATFMAPVGIGLALFVAELVGVLYTGGSLNPARSFGPCVVTGKFESEHWIYWVGPMAGTLIAVVFYRLIKILEYEMANPGADGDPINDPTQNPEKAAEIKQSGNRSSVSRSVKGS